MPRLPPLSTPSSPQESSLRLPANKRMGTPVSHRLNSITDPSNTSSRNSSTAQLPAASNDNDAVLPSQAPSSTPRRRSFASIRLPLPLPRRESGSSKISHPAPPYDFVPEPIEESLDGREPVEVEKLRQLRNEDDEGEIVLWWRRKRVIALALVVITAVALAIGLGVGLSRTKESSRKAAAAGNRTETPLEFPLKEWSLSARLVEANTGCTSNPDIWRCYPYSIGGAALFDLTIVNTSASYAPNNTAGKDEGATRAPADLLISSSNPFAIPFTNQSLTYVRSTSNSSAERFEWTFEMTKPVMPASSVMATGAAAKCSFAETVFLGTLYLSAPRSAMGEGQTRDDEWPYAVEIRQSKQGDGGPAECEGMDGGRVSVPGASGVCDCVYRNY